MKLKVLKNQGGFTSIETLIVVAIIGILVATALLSSYGFIQRAKFRSLASDLDVIEDAVKTLDLDNKIPDESRGEVLPKVLDNFVTEQIFLRKNALGEGLLWKGPNRNPFAGVAIKGPVDSFTAFLFDLFYDDGDLTSGKFRKTERGDYVAIFWEPA